MSDDDPQREPDQLDGVPLPEQQPTLIGHAVARERLWQQLAENRLPGGTLIHGPRGIGKATLAFALARELLIRTSDEPAARVIGQIAAGSHPNVFVLRRVLNKTGSNFSADIVVGQVTHREGSGQVALTERMHQTRGRAGHRICIIDSIDDCNESATNALLKILEEPPPETHFLLVSHRIGSLLPTIRSRCQELPLRPLAPAEVSELLRTTLPDADPEAIAGAVTLADGSPRRAFEALTLPPDGPVTALRGWLRDPGRGGVAGALALAEILGGKANSTESAFARDVLFGWLAGEARGAAIAGAAARGRLASATALWDKAQALFADADTYNVDMRQTFMSVFDAIGRHVSAHLAEVT
ncbi:MAG: polymerase subunit delta [Devosia sp.]|nr:polymerase subunit delta [Devosia sp.]